MAKASFRFIPDLWLRNRALRACSPAARGFWMDILALAYPSGYLVLENGKPMSDDQIASLVGSPVRLVRGWLKELGEAAIFSVSDDGKLFSSHMAKEAAFAAQAKIAGARGQELKKAKAAGPAAGAAGEHSHTAAAAALTKVDRTHTTETHGAPAAPAAETPPPPLPPPAKKALDWWKSKAGWIRKGNEQAMSMKAGEEFEEFQIRLSARIGMGRHLDVLSLGQVRAVEALIPKNPADKKD